MRLLWTEPAAEDLYRIVRYIHWNNPGAAREVAITLYAGCESLLDAPHRGGMGRRAGTRELVFAPLPYIAVYRV